MRNQALSGTLHTFMTLMKIAGKQLISMVLTMIVIISTATACANLNQLTSDHPKKSGKTNPYGSFTEGPHVFYKKGKIHVKKVHFSDAGVKLDEQVFESKEDLPLLTCVVDDKKQTSFEVTLQHTFKSPATTYKQPEKLYAISDIEGNFDAFSKNLQGNKIINSKLEWIYGKGHLVLVGDFFDRGKNVTPVLWLIYKLDQEAKKAGGMVHFIVGNHEEMNMRGDLRYVKDRYIKAAKVMKVTYPAIYSKSTELGRWLRSKNIIEKVGHTIFVHGGLSPRMALSRIRLEDMNMYAQKYYGMEEYRIEEKGGVAKAVFSKEGPMWYRGYFVEKLSQKSVDNTLNLYGAKHVVVGHTIVPQVSSLFKGKVIAIDVKHDISLLENTPSSLLILDGKLFATNSKGKKSKVESFMTEDIVRNAFASVRDGDINGVKKFLKTNDKGRINKVFFSKRVTLLQAAILHNQVEVVSYLLDNGADIEMLSGNMTPLMHAIEGNNAKIIDILINRGANINALNLQKKTPLFFCAEHNNVEVAKILVKNGARLDMKDKKGRTAEEYAIKNDSKKVAVYLKSCSN